MSSFTTPLDLRDNGNGTWTLLKEFDYEMGALGSGKMDLANVIRVPAGFRTDYASVPQLFWNILPPFGRYGKAAVLHDWLYACQCYTRSRADSLLLEAMGALGVGFMTRWTIYLGVRAGGWAAWNEHTSRRTLAAAGGLAYPFLDEIAA